MPWTKRHKQPATRPSYRTQVDEVLSSLRSIEFADPVQKTEFDRLLDSFATTYDEMWEIGRQIVDWAGSAMSYKKGTDWATTADKIRDDLGKHLDPMKVGVHKIPDDTTRGVVLAEIGRMATAISGIKWDPETKPEAIAPLKSEFDQHVDTLLNLIPQFMVARGPGHTWPEGRDEGATLQRLLALLMAYVKEGKERIQDLIKEEAETAEAGVGHMPGKPVYKDAKPDELERGIESYKGGSETAFQDMVRRQSILVSQSVIKIVLEATDSKQFAPEIDAACEAILDYLAGLSEEYKFTLPVEEPELPAVRPEDLQATVKEMGDQLAEYHRLRALRIKMAGVEKSRPSEANKNRLDRLDSQIKALSDQGIGTDQYIRQYNALYSQLEASQPVNKRL